VACSEAVDVGTVMVIDQGGALRPSRHAYDKRVAGAISGGGDMKPGIVLDRKSPGLTSLQRLDLAGCDQLRHRAPPSACNASTSEGYQGRSPWLVREKEAKAQGIAYRLFKIPMESVMRASTLSETRGF